MDPLLFARAQMGLSLAFHIVFAATGVALPVMMVLCDIMHWRTGDAVYLDLSKRFSKGTAILFAVGAVSGTVLSFELGLLWPTFMATFGELIGLPFALEGFAFFTEAIFLGIYLYGRDKVSKGLHLFSGIAVAVSGAASAFFVTLVNAFMNLPAGFELQDGKLTNLDPLQAMFSPPWSHQVIHVLISCYQATAFAMVGIHAFFLLKDRTNAFHRKALGVSLAVACVTAVLQPLSGDLSAQHVAERQPIKFAAMETLHETQTCAPLRVGGESVGVDIPCGLSRLAFHDPKAEVKGLNDFPKDQWPPVSKVHWAFQIMVACGGAMALLAVVAAFLAWRKKGLPDGKWFLRTCVAVGPLGLIAMEAGWLVTEWGRQPWVVHGVMRTADALTPYQNLGPPFFVFAIVYVFLGISVIYLLSRQLRLTDPSRSQRAS